MSLIISVILILFIYVTHLPATTGLSEGKKHFQKMREDNREHWRNEARKNDRYYDYGTGTMNNNFYGDGSLRRDMNTGRVYKKGEYYCDSRGVTANWKYAHSSVPRPTKERG